MITLTCIGDRTFPRDGGNVLRVTCMVSFVYQVQNTMATPVSPPFWLLSRVRRAGCATNLEKMPWCSIFQEAYNYYFLPFCKAHPGRKAEHDWGGLGEVLQGNELINSQLELHFKGVRVRLADQWFGNPWQAPIHAQTQTHSRTLADARR